MPGIAVYAMGSPFRRVPRVEYVYGPASASALDPIAPLLEQNVYDNYAIVFVPDIYSVWPETGIFPKVSDYSELIDSMEEFMARKCSIRLSPPACSRTTFRVVPWGGVMGAWRFTGTAGDALAFMALAVLEAAEEVRSVRIVYSVEGEDTHPALARQASTAAMAVSALLGAELRVVYAEPRPFPAEKGAESRLYDLYSATPEQAARLLAETASATASATAARKLLEPRTPKGARLRARLEHDEAAELTLATLEFYRRGMLLPLLYQACGARDPTTKLRVILKGLVERYISATELHKKTVGGNLVHHLGVNAYMLAALLAGASLEAAVLRSIGGLESCEEAYREGFDKSVVGRLADNLGLHGDTTPASCIEERAGRLRLTEGCLSKLRRKVLES